MKYLVIATIDLKSAESKDYDCVNQELAKIGLKGTLRGNSGSDVDLPHNTYAGYLTGFDNSEKLRDNIFGKAESALKACKVKGKLFIAVHNVWMQKVI